MRLNRLELLRYGRFRDAEIAFPSHADGTPDVTVIFGPNEAGKSTAFNAYLELLFGFKPGKHPYDFRFDRPNLLVGAELEIPGRGTTVLRRNSKRAQSLLDANNRPLNDAVLMGALHGLARETYEERFSLNETGLREGGVRIASAQGDLGQLLHAGLSGLTGMADTLDVLAKRSELFHKKGGRNTTLKTGAARLKEIRKVLRTEPLTPERERSLKQECVKASKTFKEKHSELGRTRDRQAAAKAAQLWYELTQSIQEHEKALADFPEGPDLAEYAAENVASLVEKIASNTQQSKEKVAQLASQQQFMDDNPVDTQAQSLEAELFRLDQLSIDNTQVMKRAPTAQSDYERLLEQQKTLSKQIADVLQHLKVPDTAASTTALVSVDLEKLDEAARSWVTTKASMDAAQQQVNTARAQTGEAPQEPKDLSVLRTAFDAWEDVKDLSVLEAEKSRCASYLTTVTASLPATWTNLIAAGIPVRETIDHVVATYMELNVEHLNAREHLDACLAERVSAKAELAAMESAPDTVDIVAIEDSRRKRDLEWQRHRAQLTMKTADQFEQLMYVDDSHRAHFLAGAEARQRLHEAQRNLQKIEAQNEADNASFILLSEQYNKLSERCKELAIKLGLEEDAPPSSFNQRQQELNTAAKAVAELANAQSALDSQLELQKSANKALTDIAGLLEIDVAEGDQFVHVQRLLLMEDNERKAWGKWQKNEQVIAKLDEALTKSQRSHAKAQDQFEQLTATLPLADLSPENIQAELPQLRHLHKLNVEQQHLAVQIDTYAQIVAALSETAKRLIRIMGTETEEGAIDPFRVIDSARERLSVSKRADQDRARAITELDMASKRIDELGVELDQAQTQLALLFVDQGYPELEPRERVVKLVERDRWRALKATAVKDRKKAKEGVDQDIFTEELSRLPNATRKAELEQELLDAQELRDTARDAHNEAERLHREACESADRSDLATEAATLIEGLRHDARQAAVARLGVHAARGALRRLAKERRSDMLRDVANAFVTMTSPDWRDVDVWSQTEGDKLVGIRHDGKSVPVENMSTGTMGQLYFALRLAGYQSFARDPGPLPMILDDIMETFDDTRARAALGLCGEIGKTGQAILFTHHAHLVELARDSIDGVAVVEIPH